MLVNRVSGLNFGSSSKYNGFSYPNSRFELLPTADKLDVINDKLNVIHEQLNGLKEDHRRLSKNQVEMNDFNGNAYQSVISLLPSADSYAENVGEAASLESPKLYLLY